MVVSIQALDGRLGLLIAAHLDESEALAAAGFAVRNDLGTLDRAKRGEQILQI
jgi:hypothetical protein